MAFDQYREHTFFAFEAVPDLSIPPTAGTRQQTTLQAAHYDFWEYGDATDMASYWTWMVPEDFDDTAGEFSVAVYWETDTNVGTEGVNWDVELVGRADGEDINVALSTAFAEFESLADGGAARDLNIKTATLAGTTGLTKGDLMVLSVRRDVDGTNDDLTDTARLIKVVIQYHTLGANNLKWAGGAPAAGKVWREKFFPASKFLGDKTVPPAAGTRQATTLQAAHYDFWTYADDADDAAYVHWMVPEDFDDTSASFSVRVYWETDTSVGTEGVNWDVELIGRTDSENIDVAFATAFAEAESLADGGAARDLNVFTATLAGTSGMTKSDLAILSIRRDVDGTHDDLTDTARLIGVGIQWLADEGGANAQWA